MWLSAKCCLQDILSVGLFWPRVLTILQTATSAAAILHFTVVTASSARVLQRFDRHMLDSDSVEIHG